MHLQGEGHATADAVRELTDLNEMILEAEEEGRTADLEPRLTADFTIVRASGEKQDRQKFLAAVPGNAGRGRVADQPGVQLYDECAVFTCRVTTTRNADGTPGGGRYWNTRLFVREAAGWRCAAWQVMGICKA